MADAEALHKVLNLNAPVAPGKDPGELYKILILDRYGQDAASLTDSHLLPAKVAKHNHGSTVSI
jgi:hypothetical protein